jgi:hypothetical protein
LFVHGKLGNELGNMLRGEKFAAGFARIGRIVGNEKFVGIAEEVDLVILKICRKQPATPFRTAAKRVFLSLTVLPRRLLVVSKSAKKAFYIVFGRVAAGGAFDGAKIAAKSVFRLGLSLAFLATLAKSWLG